ncbi:MAG: DUF924 domain-containing protein [Colwellia sp.]|nr:DUF924 domain-containing protein [Colwellia sp.]
MVKAEQILRYWFGPLDNQLSKQSQSALWYQATPLIDQEITSQFHHLYQQALTQPFNHWNDSARGSLALVILLDQLPRNMYRGTAQAFLTDQKSLETVKAGISLGFDDNLALIERIFYYHPFEHSEKLTDQEQSVELFTKLLTKYPDEVHQAVIQNAVDFAVEHLEIIKRFGRFPHRNKVLNRQSTTQELEYLKSGNDFGQSTKS